MSKKDIRWQQRFENYTKAIQNLEKAAGIAMPSDVERAGVIQFYEIAFELGWKTLKDYLEVAGYNPVTPRETIKQAYQVNLLDDGHAWMEMLDKRNMLTHTYDEKQAEEALTQIRDIYLRHLVQLFELLKSKQ